MRKHFVFFLLVMIFSFEIFGQNLNDDLESEIGFWVGGTFPAPNTPMDELLESSMGFGLFYRNHSFAPVLTEIGTSYGNYTSLSMQKLLSVPLYLSLNYLFQLYNRFSLQTKIGGGFTYLQIRPNNLSGWNPILYGGVEFSISASRRFKVGLRFDGYYIYERLRREPKIIRYLYFFPGTYDPRIQNSLNYKLRDGAVYNFGLMVSFLY
ncbi:MAG: hypothetical protein NZ853_00410 [Leptospiraceae bacterium]|nr:hypothetical protein [Leptospiraceae bacterium]MDW7976310.1 hypothetical protein [Leptospiraceae bacterium]